MLHRSLPVLGGAAPADRLELVRSQPLAVEQNASVPRPVLARRPGAQEHDSHVAATRYPDLPVRTEPRRCLCTQTTISYKKSELMLMRRATASVQFRTQVVLVYRQ